jgi:membrane protein YdbS with pleckstrin-like domain
VASGSDQSEARGGGSVHQVDGASGPIRVIQPVIVPAQFLVWGPIVAGFLAFFPGFFTFVISNMLAMPFSPTFGPGLVAYGLVFAVILGLIGLNVFFAPRLTSYAIYPDRIEFAEGLFSRRRRTVLLDKIMDVQLSEGVLQRTAGAGSIVLVSNQIMSLGQGRWSNQTFRLSNVPDPGGVYELIRSLALGGRGVKSTLPE